jgi:putative membrane protein
MMVAYPLMSLDQIGIELQNPFSKANLSHLPIGDISANIEKTLLGLWQAKQAVDVKVPPELDGRIALSSRATHAS